MTQNSQQRHGWPTTGDLESNSLSAFPTIPDQNFEFPFVETTSISLFEYLWGTSLFQGYYWYEGYVCYCKVYWLARYALNLSTWLLCPWSSDLSPQKCNADIDRTTQSEDDLEWGVAASVQESPRTGTWKVGEGGREGGIGGPVTPLLIQLLNTSISALDQTVFANIIRQNIWKILIWGAGSFISAIGNWHLI